MADFLPAETVDEIGLLGDIGPNADPLEAEYWEARRKGKRG